MFISSLYIDKWVARADIGHSVDRPSWADIEAAIMQLDGTTRTSVMLKKDDETYMSIGGGPIAFSVTVLIENKYGPFYLVDPTKGSQEVILVVGGQGVDFPARMTVSLESVLQAAKTFAESGLLEKRLVWQEGI
jgi:hypothetical protein